MKFTTALSSNIGGRENNDDFASYVYNDNSYGAWIIADGLGGYPKGHTASKVAVECSIEEFLLNNQLSPDNIENIFKKANIAVIDAQEDKKMINKMRTTIVGLFTDLNKVLWAHAGDSRLYFFKNGVLTFQTMDHSVSQMAVLSGDISPINIRFHEDRNKLLRVLGNDTEIKIDVLKQPIEVNKGDAFLLCTDGFWELVYEVEMEIDLCKSNSPDVWLQYMIERLYRRVSQGNDNFSAIAVFVE